MEKVTAILKGGPNNGEQVEVERGRPYIEVASLEKPLRFDLKEWNSKIPAKNDYIRSLYKISNRSDMEYDYCEPKPSTGQYEKGNKN